MKFVIIFLLLVFVSSSVVYGQVGKGDLFGFVEGSCKSTTSFKHDDYEGNYTDTYTHESMYSGLVGVKLAISRNLMVGLATKFEHNYFSSDRKYYDKKVVVSVSSLRSDSGYTVSSNLEVSRSNLVRFCPGITYYKSYKDKVSLLLNLDVLVQKVFGNQSLQSEQYGYVRGFTRTFEYWNLGVSFSPGILIKVVNRIHFYYAPFSVSYLQGIGKYKYPIKTDIMANFNPISFGFYFKLNGEEN